MKREFRFWCQKVLPLVYDDSLSYYELLCKVVKRLNELYDDNNEIVKALTELKEYVDNYFDTQDFEQLVDDRIDELIEDGTISDLINQEIFENLNQAIADVASDVDALELRVDNVEDKTSGAGLHNQFNTGNYATMTKVGDFAIPTGHSTQGMAYDGTYFYVLHHLSDASDMLCSKFRASDLAFDSSVTVDNGIHCNSLEYNDGYLWACDSIKHRIYLISCSPFAVVGYDAFTSSANFNLSCLAICGDTGQYAVGAVTGTYDYVIYQKNSNGKYQLIGHFNYDYLKGNLGRQDVSGTQNHIYQLMSNVNDSVHCNNSIILLTPTGNITQQVYLPDVGEELEGIVRVTTGSVVYISTVSGALYTVDYVAGIWSNPAIQDPTSIRGSIGLDYAMRLSGTYSVDRNNLIFDETTGKLIGWYVPTDIDRIAYARHCMNYFGRWFGLAVHGSSSWSGDTVRVNGIYVTATKVIYLTGTFTYSTGVYNLTDVRCAITENGTTTIYSGLSNVNTAIGSSGRDYIEVCGMDMYNFAGYSWFYSDPTMYTEI